MSAEPPSFQAQMGSRIARARAAAGLTQSDLAAKLDLDRTAITKIESGTRAVSAQEMVKLGTALGRSLQWLVQGDLPQVASRRDSQPAQVETRAEAELDRLARDVEQLQQLGVLRGGTEWRPSRTVESPSDGEAAAREARQQFGQLGLARGPIRDLAGVADRFGLHCAVVDLGSGPEGLYLPLPDGSGVALINGASPPGRRRFTLAHELGHHLLANEYSVDWNVGGDEESEKVINAFAIHFLMPCEDVREAWPDALARAGSVRGAAVTLAASWGCSWTAAVTQMCRVGVIDTTQFEDLRHVKPSAAEHLEHEAVPVDDLHVPSISAAIAGAVVRANKKSDISAGRALEMGRGALHLNDLPEVSDAPIEALLSQHGRE